MRKLASIQRVTSVEPIENADAIEKLKILGWTVVAKKSEFKTGDWCVFVEIDSILPEVPEFEFLRKNKFRIKTIRLRGVYSQGLALPIEVLSKKDINLTTMVEGEDVTELLGIEKYEPPVSVNMGGITFSFPSFIPKTDEPRIQTVPDVLERHKGKIFYITEKMDGTSCTFYKKDDHFGVCSRNLEIEKNDNNLYWTVANKLHMDDKLEFVSGNFALQGEICGPGIQSNKYKLDDYAFYVFNVYDIDNKEYLSFYEFIMFLEKIELNSVPVISSSFRVPLTVEEMIEYSKFNSTVNPAIQAEGIVVRTKKEDTDFEIGRVSFKAINPDFLIKYDE